MLQRPFRILPAHAGTGDPDPKGSRESARLKRGACSEGTRRKPDTDGRANRIGFARRRAFTRAPRHKSSSIRRSQGGAPFRVVTSLVTSLAIEGLQAIEARPFPGKLRPLPSGFPRRPARLVDEHRWW